MVSSSAGCDRCWGCEQRARPLGVLGQPGVVFTVNINDEQPASCDTDTGDGIVVPMGFNFIKVGGSVVKAVGRERLGIDVGQAWKYGITEVGVPQRCILPGVHRRPR